MSDATTEVARQLLRESSDPRVIVVDGYSVKMSVRHPYLVIQDGIRSGHRVRRISRADTLNGKIRRIFMLTQSGYVTLDALAWCRELGITVCQLDPDGNAIFVTGPSPVDARLMTAQVTARQSDIGHEITALLDQAKRNGQAENIRKLTGSDAYASRILSAQNEGAAASEYWKAWNGRINVPFPVEELMMVPPHWYGFSQRSSLRNPLNQGKNATDPVNAMLNYAYSVAETECRIACYIMGLHPGIGFSHGEYRKDQDSLALDMLEAIRPASDTVVMGMLDTGNGPPVDPDTGKLWYVRKAWFYETPEGTCRMYPPLTTMLSTRVSAATAHDAGQWAERIARMLAGSSAWTVRTLSYMARRSATPETGPSRALNALTVRELVPDDVWERVRAIIPPDEPRADRRHKTPRADARTVLAAIVRHEMHGQPWKTLPADFGCGWYTARRRYMEWCADGTWQKITASLRPATH